MNIGLVLSGGMAKGAYQVGALRAIGNFIPKEEIRYMSCASVGVLNGYAYATDALDKVEQTWLDLCSDDTYLFVNQIMRSSMLQQSIRGFYAPEKTLPEAFYCSLLDINRINLVYRDLSAAPVEKIPQYLKASVAMPVCNRPVSMGKATYFDGAMVDNIPVFPLIKHDPDYVICIYFDDVSYKFETPAFDKKVIKLTFPAENTLKQSLVFRRSSIQSMMETGYSRTCRILEQVVGEHYDDPEHVRAMIEQRNRKFKNTSLRITGDVLVTNLNKITKKLTNRKIIK